MRRLCLFCGSGAGTRPAYRAAAGAFGRALAGRGIGLVYGGASVGLMGAAADAVLAAGGEVTGVIPHGLVAREVAHPGLSALHVVDTMHERKARMAELADGFVALPGGLGTLEELFEVWTWGQLGVHRKPVAVLDVDGFWQPLLAFLGRGAEEGFVRPAHLAALVVAEEPTALLDALAAWHPPEGPRWLTAAET